MFFLGGDDGEDSVRRIGLRGEHDVRPHRRDVEHLDDDELALHELVVHGQGQAAGQQARQHVAILANGADQLVLGTVSLVAGRRRDHRGNSGGDQTAADPFDEATLAPSAQGGADVERDVAAVPPPFDQLGDRAVEPQASGDIVGGTDGKDGQRQSPTGHRDDGPPHRAVAAGDNRELRGFGKHGREFGAMVDHADHLVPRLLDAASEAGNRHALSSLPVTTKRDSHVGTR